MIALATSWIFTFVFVQAFQLLFNPSRQHYQEENGKCALIGKHQQECNGEGNHHQNGLSNNSDKVIRNASGDVLDEEECEDLIPLTRHLNNRKNSFSATTPKESGENNSSSSSSTSVLHFRIASASSPVVVNSSLREVYSQLFSKFEVLIRNLGILGGILLLVYLGHTKNSLLFETTEKVYSRDLFISICVISLICRFLTLTKNKETVMSREQSEEWKGWMQLIFLLYHYYNAQEIYAPIRIFVSCYVWMSGFGNFSYFYNSKGDMSLKRFLQMMWRLNFSAVAFCLVTGNSYFLYYIVPLHTMYFLMVFIVMRIGRNWNESFVGIRIKLIANLVIIYAIWETPALYRLIFAGPFDLWKQYLWKSNLDYHDFYFRTYLDHYSAFFGMLFALNFDSLKELMNSINKSPHRIILSTALIMLTSSMIIIWCYIYFPLTKTAYNSFHPYFSCVPIVAFVYLRNSTSLLRSYYMKFYQFIGVVTLETYLLQHHVLMSDNAKSILVIRGMKEFPLLNSILFSLLFMFLSYQLYDVTIKLRDCIFTMVSDWTSAGICFGYCSIMYLITHLLQDSILQKNSLFLIILFICSLALVQLIGFGMYSYFSPQFSQKRISLILVILCGSVLLFQLIAKHLFNTPTPQKEVNGFIGNSYYQGFLVICSALAIILSGDSLFGIFHVICRLLTRNFTSKNILSPKSP